MFRTYGRAASLFALIASLTCGAGASAKDHFLTIGGGRDLQFEDPDIEPPRVNQLLAEIFNRETGLTTQYRPHAIPNLWGASGRASIGRWFETIGAKLAEGD